MKYYIVYVGDDPEDGYCNGPFDSAVSALKNMSDSEIGYYVISSFHRPVDWVGPNIYGWHAAISSLYIVGHEGDDKPTYEKDIRPMLFKVSSGEIKRQYDEE